MTLEISRPHANFKTRLTADLDNHRLTLVTISTCIVSSMGETAGKWVVN